MSLGAVRVHSTYCTASNTLSKVQSDVTASRGVHMTSNVDRTSFIDQQIALGGMGALGCNP